MQCRVDLAVREDGRATHDWTNGVCVENTLSCSWQEVGGFATLEILVKIDQEGEKRALLFLGGRVVVYVFVVLGDAARGPCAVDVCSILGSWDTALVS